MGRPKLWDVQVVVRLPQTTVDQLDAHAAKLKREIGLDVTRAQCVRLALELGLKALHAEETVKEIEQAAHRVGHPLKKEDRRRAPA